MYKWEHFTPGTCFMLVYILAVALGFAVGVMLLWQLYLVSRGYVIPSPWFPPFHAKALVQVKQRSRIMIIPAMLKSPRGVGR